MRRPVLRLAFAAAGRERFAEAPETAVAAAGRPSRASGKPRPPLAVPATIRAATMIARTVLERLRRAARKARYRPEKRYMRGGGRDPGRIAQG